MFSSSRDIELQYIEDVSELSELKRQEGDDLGLQLYEKEIETTKLPENDYDDDYDDDNHLTPTPPPAKKSGRQPLALSRAKIQLKPGRKPGTFLKKDMENYYPKVSTCK